MPKLSKVSVVVVLALAAACTPRAAEGWFSIGYMGDRDPRGRVQVLAYFLRPALGRNGMNDEVLGCFSREASRVALVTRLSLAEAGSMVSAGTLTITPRGAAPYVVRASPPSWVYGASGPAFHAANQPIDVGFVGDDVPPFHGTVIAPSAVTLTEPPCGANELVCPPFDRTRDLVVRWPPASDGFVAVEVVAPGDTLFKGHCIFDARAGAGTIPKAFVPPNGDVSLRVHRYVSTRLTAAEGSVLHLRVDAPSSQRSYPLR